MPSLFFAIIIFHSHTPGIHSLLLTSCCFLSFCFTPFSLRFQTYVLSSKKVTAIPTVYLPVFIERLLSMMRLSILSILAIGFATLAQGTIMSLTAGNSWQVGTNQMISWDTTGLAGPVDIHIVPEGATDIAAIIENIVVGTGNSGWFN
jgi:hypothetical protein